MRNFGRGETTGRDAYFTQTRVTENRMGNRGGVLRMHQETTRAEKGPVNLTICPSRSPGLTHKMKIKRIMKKNRARRSNVTISNNLTLVIIVIPEADV